MKVVNVKFINNKVEIILEKKNFFISKENYIENPIAIDSEVGEEKINFLLKQERVIESKIEIVKLLNKKTLSEKEIVQKLKDKELDKKDIENIIESLKRVGLINDDYYASLLVESLLIKRKGKIEIKNILKEKGIEETSINKVISEIEEEIYVGNFNKVYEKYLKMYSSKSSKVKKQMVLNKLKEYGYENELISQVFFEKNDDEELALAVRNIQKMLKNKKVDLNNYENLNKIKSKLVMKGFNYDIINLALEEVIKDETN